MNATLSSRFFNPMMLWLDVALTTQEMLVSSGEVIRLRTEQMARAGLSPSAHDLAEIRLMGEEKLAAASESGAAITSQLNASGVSLVNRAVQHWFGSAAALVGLATSLTPTQAAVHGNALMEVGKRVVANASHVSSAGARVAQRGLKPIHAKATSNARRLAKPAPDAAA
ncbi:hypothetical protein BH10PSE18_BH10PSE18_25210 [soil metagenome]